VAAGGARWRWLCAGVFFELNAAMTHYGTGSAPVFFGAGYVAQALVRLAY